MNALQSKKQESIFRSVSAFLSAPKYNKLWGIQNRKRKNRIKNQSISPVHFVYKKTVEFLFAPGVAVRVDADSKSE